MWIGSTKNIQACFQVPFPNARWINAMNQPLLQPVGLVRCRFPSLMPKRTGLTATILSRHPPAGMHVVPWVYGAVSGWGQKPPHGVRVESTTKPINTHMGRKVNGEDGSTEDNPAAIKDTASPQYLSSVCAVLPSMLSNPSRRYVEEGEV